MEIIGDIIFENTNNISRYFYDYFWKNAEGDYVRKFNVSAAIFLWLSKRVSNFENYCTLGFNKKMTEDKLIGRLKSKSDCLKSYLRDTVGVSLVSTNTTATYLWTSLPKSYEQVYSKINCASNVYALSQEGIQFLKSEGCNLNPKSHVTSVNNENKIGDRRVKLFGQKDLLMRIDDQISFNQNLNKG
jgi:hypothetical protein